MKPTDQVGVTFVNTVIGRGILNNVVNVTFAVFQFSPGEKAVEADPAIACRLRMDIRCARALHAELADLLALIDASALPPAEAITEVRQPDEALN